MGKLNKRGRDKLSTKLLIKNESSRLLQNFEWRSLILESALSGLLPSLSQTLTYLFSYSFARSVSDGHHESAFIETTRFDKFHGKEQKHDFFFAQNEPTVGFKHV